MSVDEQVGTEATAPAAPAAESTPAVESIPAPETKSELHNLIDMVEAAFVHAEHFAEAEFAALRAKLPKL